MMRYKMIKAGLCALLLLSSNLTVFAAAKAQVYKDPVIETEPAMEIEDIAETEPDEEMIVQYEEEERQEDGEEVERQKDDIENLNGEVVNVRSHLNIRSGAGKDYEVIGHLLLGDEVEVISGNGEWYEIVAPETEGYVYGSYLELFQEPESEKAPDVITDTIEIPSPEPSQGLTPVGNMTLVDNIGAISQAGQQFITLVTKNGNYFYLVIDRDDKGSENVHFLSLVDERDLLSLLSDEEAEEYEAEKEEIREAKEPEPEETVDEDIQNEEVKKKGNILLFISIVMIVIIIGAFFIMKKSKPKGKKNERPDPDIDYVEDDDDSYILPEGEYEDENEKEDALDNAVYTPEIDE